MGLLRTEVRIRVADSAPAFDTRLRDETVPWVDERTPFEHMRVIGRFEAERTRAGIPFRVRRIGKRRNAGRVTARCSLEGGGAFLRADVGIAPETTRILLGWAAAVTAGLGALVQQELQRGNITPVSPWMLLPLLPSVLVALAVLAIRADIAQLVAFLTSLCQPAPARPPAEDGGGERALTNR